MFFDVFLLGNRYIWLKIQIPGEKICFELIKLHEAEQMYKEHLNNISETIKNIKEINWLY